MIFNEQYYRNTQKIYWHGSKYPTYNKDLARFKYFFITPDFEYAARYALDRVNLKIKYMYACTLKKPLNIFNPRSANDEYKFRKRFNPTNEEFETLKGEAWLDILGLEDRERIVDAIRLLGYDGFFNFEYNKEGASLGIFDPDNIHISKVYEGQEILDFVDLNKDLCQRKNRQKRDLRESCFKIYPSLLTRKDFKEILDIDSNFEERYEEILENRRERKLERGRKKLEEYNKLDKGNPIYEQLLRSYELSFEDLKDMLYEKNGYKMSKWKEYD